MDPGKLREVVDIWRRTITRSARKAATTTFSAWQTNFLVAVKPLTGKALQIADAAGTGVTHDVRMRAIGMEDLKEYDRLLWRHAGRDRILEVTSIVNIGARDTELVVMCTELVGKTDITAA